MEHYVSTHEMRERCTPYVAFGMLPEACAEFNFAANRCDLWFSADFPPPASIVEHERLHVLHALVAAVMRPAASPKPMLR